QLLDQDRVVQVVAALPAVLLRVLEAEKAVCRKLRKDLVGEPFIALPLLRMGRQLALDEAPDRLAQLLVLVGEGGRGRGHVRVDLAVPVGACADRRDGACTVPSRAACGPAIRSEAVR